MTTSAASGNGRGRAFAFGSRMVGPGAPTLTIAELSGNHNGSLERAIAMVEAAAKAGVDVVKVQTYTADTITLNSDAPSFRAHGLWEGRTLYDLYAEAAMPWEWQRDLAAECARHGVEFFSSVFDVSSIEFLESMGVAGYKIASFEIVDIPLIRATAATGKPVIMSTGMATFDEIAEAVDAVRGTGNEALALLVCTSAYPAPAEAANVRTIPDLAARTDAIVGLSDHTMGLEVPLAAVSLGASVVEKHFTLRRADGGVDSAFSLESEEFAALVDSIRTTEAALGGVHYGPTDADRTSLQYRRSLFVARDVAAGSVLGPDDVRSVRPSDGLHPRHLPEILGKLAVRDLSAGTPFHWDMIGIDAS
ncbi:MAG: pseudaminic acid synthase [Acidimicrobiia bacterium]